jgi:hypothetical protein
MLLGCQEAGTAHRQLPLQSKLLKRKSSQLQSGYLAALRQKFDELF